MNKRTWTVHRDGVAWRVQASDPIVAVSRARPDEWWRVDVETGGWLKGYPERLGKATRGKLGAPLALARMTVRGFAEGVLLVSAGAGSRKLIVSRVDNLSLTDALHFTLVIVNEWRSAESDRPERLGVERYKSGEREGQLRFTRDHDDAFRRRAREVERRNAARAVQLSDARACLIETASLLQCLTLAADPAALDEQESALRLLAGTLPYFLGEAKAWCSQQLESVADVRSKLESVKAVGFGVGARCIVEKDPNAWEDELHPVGVCEVLEVYSETVTSYGKTETLHYRDVLDAAGREWNVPAASLERVGEGAR